MNFSVLYAVLKTLEITCEKQQCLFPEQCPSFFGLSTDLAVDRFALHKRTSADVGGWSSVNRKLYIFDAVSSTKKKKKLPLLYSCSGTVFRGGYLKTSVHQSEAVHIIRHQYCAALCVFTTRSSPVLQTVSDLFPFMS